MDHYLETLHKVMRGDLQITLNLYTILFYPQTFTYLHLSRLQGATIIGNIHQSMGMATAIRGTG